jgi:transcriptional regulator with XRE-family HTH domain
MGRVRGRPSRLDRRKIKSGWPGKIRALRYQRGMTQEELGRRVGLTRLQITNIEAGRYGTSIRRLMSIAKALDVEMADIFAHDDADRAAAEHAMAGLIDHESPSGIITSRIMRTAFRHLHLNHDMLRSRDIDGSIVQSRGVCNAAAIMLGMLVRTLPDARMQMAVLKAFHGMLSGVTGWPTKVVMIDDDGQGEKETAH